MKNITLSVLTIVLLAGLVFGGAAPAIMAGEEPGHLLVEHLLGETLAPIQAKRVVVFDFGALDTLDKLGIDIVGLPKSSLPGYLAHYADAKYANVGSLKEPDFERVYALAPDLIIISARQSELYDELSAIAPTIYVGIDNDRYIASFEENARLLGRLFAKEAAVEEALAKINADIAALRATVEASRKNALVVLVNDAAVSAYGPNSRFGLIHDALGFPPADANITASTHGQSISFEYIMVRDPDYLFVIDRTAAIGGTSSAKQLVENQLIRFTKAYQAGQIVYLDPENWYLSGGGLISLQAMVDEVRRAVK